MKQTIKCYAAAYAENGRINYYFNRMPDDTDTLTDSASFAKDKSVASFLSHEQTDELKGILCKFMSKKNLCPGESKPRGTYYRIDMYNYYIKFDLTIETQPNL